MDETAIDTLVNALVPRISRALRSKPRKELLSIKQAALMLGVSHDQTIHQMIAEKRIKAVTVCGKMRIPASEIDRICREGC